MPTMRPLFGAFMTHCGRTIRNAVMSSGDAIAHPRASPERDAPSTKTKVTQLEQRQDCRSAHPTAP
jgi:hypothetical protein